MGFVKQNSQNSETSRCSNIFEISSADNGSTIINNPLTENLDQNDLICDNNLDGLDVTPVDDIIVPLNYTHMDVIKVALIISPVWFLSNCLYNYSLLLTSVSSSTIISNLSASFTLFFSWLMGLEEITSFKIIGIITCFIGAVSVTLLDSSSDDDNSHSVVGDIIALISAIGYGVYTTMIRHKVMISLLL